MVIMGNTTVTKQYGWEYYTPKLPGHPVYYLTKQIHPRVAIVIKLIHKSTGEGAFPSVRYFDVNEIHVRRIVYKHPYSGNPLTLPLDNIASDSEIDAMDNPYPEVVKKYLTNVMKKYGKVIKEKL